MTEAGFAGWGFWALAIAILAFGGITWLAAFAAGVSVLAFFLDWKYPL